MKAFKDAGWKPKAGYQLRYIYFLDPSARERLRVAILPFSETGRHGAGMYRAQRISRVASDTIDTPPDQGGKGGETPTATLHPRQDS